MGREVLLPGKPGDKLCYRCKQKPRGRYRRSGAQSSYCPDCQKIIKAGQITIMVPPHIKDRARRVAKENGEKTGHYVGGLVTSLFEAPAPEPPLIGEILEAKAPPTTLRLIMLALLTLAALIIAGTLMWAQLAKAECYPGVAVKVYDGDTITVQDERQAIHKVRLAEVDTPEIKMPWGVEARDYTRSLVLGKQVEVCPEVVDFYGREVASIKTPDGKDLAEELLLAGWAWWYRDYSKNGRLGRLEERARLAGKGLWPTPPWKWRKERRAKR